MLNQDEELWEKHLPPMVEGLLASAKDPLSDRSDRSKTPAEDQVKPRDKTRVISFRVPHNAAVQIYDYKEKKARSEHMNITVDKNWFYERTLRVKTRYWLDIVFKPNMNIRKKCLVTYRMPLVLMVILGLWDVSKSHNSNSIVPRCCDHSNIELLCGLEERGSTVYASS
jgi:hypothetical protein